MVNSLAERCNLSEDNRYRFDLTRGSVAGPDVTAECGALLYEGLLEVGYIERLLADRGLDSVARYLASRGFVGRLGLRVADLGEVLSAAVICENEDLHQPIHKLRYRERSDWPMRLTDLFALRVVEDRVTGFCFGSVKSGVTRPRDRVAIEGYDQLLADAKNENPQIVGFVSERLFQEENYDELDRIDEALANAQPIDKMFRLSLVYDTSIWNERLLANLHDEYEEFLPGFRTYHLLVGNMRELVTTAYDAAGERCFGR